MRETNKKTDTQGYNYGFGLKDNMSLSFYSSLNKEEINILLSVWSGNEITAMRYFPYSTIVNAFSNFKAEYNKNTPMVTDDVNVSDCGSKNYNRWESWANFLINDKSATTVYPDNFIYPTPQLQVRSEDRFQVSIYVKEFMEELKKVYKTSYPEILLYPVVKDDLNLGWRVSPQFKTIFSQEKIWSFSKEKPRHLTYYFDKCPSGQTGHFYQMLNVVMPALRDGIKKDGTGQLTDKTWEEKNIFILSGKSFLNLPLNRDALKYLGTCNTDVNGGFGGDAACPNIKTDIQITKENSVFITFKTIEDISCEYLVSIDDPKRGYIYPEMYNDYSTKDMTFLLYLGVFGKQGKSK